MLINFGFYWIDVALSTKEAVCLHFKPDIYMKIMMMWSNENIFRVTGPLCGEFTGQRGIHRTKASDAEFDVFFDLRLNKQLSKLSRHRWFENPSRELWRNVVRDVLICRPDIPWL